MSALEQGLPPSRRVTWLQSIRILSRDRSCLAAFTRRQSLQALARSAGVAEGAAPGPLDMDAVLESLKCLCNLVLSSPQAQALAAEARLVVRLAQRVGLHGESSFPHEVQLFDLRLLFLLTALRPEVRQQLFQELQGVPLLAEALQLTLGAGPGQSPPERLPPQQTERAMEVLKVLFNITFDSVRREVDEVRAALRPRLLPPVSGVSLGQDAQPQQGAVRSGQLVREVPRAGEAVWREAERPFSMGEVRERRRSALAARAAGPCWQQGHGRGSLPRSPLLSARTTLPFTGAWGLCCGTV